MKPMAMCVAAAAMIFAAADLSAAAGDHAVKQLTPMKREAPVSPPVALGRNIKLTFFLRGAEVPPMTIYTATSTYSIVLDFNNDAATIASDIAGEIHPV